jgi:hypothetical protein
MNNDKTMLELIYQELMALRQEIAYIKGRQDGMEDRICKKLDSMPNVQQHTNLPIFDHRVDTIDFSTVVCKK